MSSQSGFSGGQYGNIPDQEFQVRTRQSSLTWDFHEVQPNAPLYITNDDVIDVRWVTPNSGNPLTVNYRILRPDQTILYAQQALPSNIFASFQVFTIQVAEGFLLSFAITQANASSEQGYSYATACVRHGQAGVTNSQMLLVAGYIDQTVPISWPYGLQQRPTDGLGVLKNATISAPAAGAELSISSPNFTRWQILAVRATLTTALAAANRQVQLQLLNVATVMWESTPGPIQAATLAWDYTFASFGYAPINTLNKVSSHMSDALMISSGNKIQSLTTNLQAADQWSSASILVREWYESV